MKYRLRIEEHQEYGEKGVTIISPNRRDYHDPATSGFTLAHDIIEHPVNPHPDPFIDELLALGGFVAGRVENNHISNIYGLTTGIRGLLDYAPDSFMENSLYPNNTKLKSVENYSKIKEAVKLVNSEYSRESEEDIVHFNDQLVTSWVCEGYRRFKNRFRRYDAYYICNHMFPEIEKKVDYWINNAEYLDEADLFVRFSDYYVELVVDS